MSSWQQALHGSLTDPDLLAARFGLPPEPLRRVAARYPLRLTPYYLDLITAPGDPLWRMTVPDEAELSEDEALLCDPMGDRHHSPVPGLVHRYPDRALLLLTRACAVYCRFCTRKQSVGDTCGDNIDLVAALDYLRRTAAIREVILSGGDPLLYDDAHLDDLLGRLRSLSHIETIRIHSRMPAVLPARVTPELCTVLRRHHPLYLNTHFNHPAELTAAAGEACRRLADAGIPLGNQTVLLAGINDDAATLEQLFRTLLRWRVRPYYLHQMDPVCGAGHFRTPLTRGLELLGTLRGRLTGTAIPHFVVDLPGGKGKITLAPQSPEWHGDRVVVRAGDGTPVVLTEPPAAAAPGSKEPR